MTERERFITALERKPLTGRVPHFELVFFLTMEVLGKVHPVHRNYSQYNQMSTKEKLLHLEDMADLYIKIAEMYEHSAIFVHNPPGTNEDFKELLQIIAEKSDRKYFVMTHGDATFEIPNGNDLENFIYRLADYPEEVHKEAEERLKYMIDRAEDLKSCGCLDGFALCSDYCFNTNPFLSPAMFEEFIAPYLAKEIKEYRDMGYYTIKHTDGNIMPILDQLVDAKPDALHSLDPQGGVDIAEVKKLVGDKVCLIGNVNCGLMQTGTEEEVIASAEYSLKHGMPGGGYIFSTSNCIYTGMPLERYELILDVWRKKGIYE